VITCQFLCHLPAEISHSHDDGEHGAFAEDGNSHSSLTGCFVVAVIGFPAHAIVAVTRDEDNIGGDTIGVLTEGSLEDSEIKFFDLVKAFDGLHLEIEIAGFSGEEGTAEYGKVVPLSSNGHLDHLTDGIEFVFSGVFVYGVDDFFFGLHVEFLLNFLKFFKMLIVGIFCYGEFFVDFFELSSEFHEVVDVFELAVRVGVWKVEKGFCCMLDDLCYQTLKVVFEEAASLKGSLVHISLSIKSSLHTLVLCLKGIVLFLG